MFTFCDTPIFLVFHPRISRFATYIDVRNYEIRFYSKGVILKLLEKLYRKL